MRAISWYGLAEGHHGIKQLPVCRAKEKFKTEAAGQVLAIPPPCLLPPYILRSAELLSLPQDTVNDLSAFHIPHV